MSGNHCGAAGRAEASGQRLAASARSSHAKSGSSTPMRTHAIAACAGMGARRSAGGAGSDGRVGPVHRTCCSRLAGPVRSCRSSPGNEFRCATVVIDAQTGEQFGLTRRIQNMAISHDGCGRRRCARKARLVAAYPEPALVDMEAATVARIGCHARQFLCFAIKGISDEVGIRTCRT